MRIAGIERMGYYPTPPETLSIIINHWLTAKNGGSSTALRPRSGQGSGRSLALDPCCGKGEALAAIARAFQLETYGVELSYDRADAARQVLDRVINAAWEDVALSNKLFSFALTNPPYDWEGGNQDEAKDRHELTFLRSTTPKLVSGGVLCYIVPQYRLDARIVRHLAGYYHTLEMRRLPADEYQVFRQVVVWGVRKENHGRDPEMEAQLLEWAAMGETLPPLDAEPITPYVIPPVQSKKVQFYRINLSSEELTEIAALHGGLHSRAWQDMTGNGNGNGVAHLTPVLPLKTGHVAMLMAAGMMGIMRLQDNGTPLLVKGRVHKTLVLHESEAKDDGTVKETYREKFVTEVTSLSPDGEVETISDAARLGEFMDDHGDEIAGLVVDLHAPRYDLKPRPEEWAARRPPGSKQPWNWDGGS